MFFNLKIETQNIIFYLEIETLNIFLVGVGILNN